MRCRQVESIRAGLTDTFPGWARAFAHDAVRRRHPTPGKSEPWEVMQVRAAAAAAAAAAGRERGGGR